MKDLLKYFTAFWASSGVLYPTYPMRRCGISFASVMACLEEKCFLNSSSEIVGGKPLMKILEDSISASKTRTPSYYNKEKEERRKVIVFRKTFWGYKLRSEKEKRKRIWTKQKKCTSRQNHTKISNPTNGKCHHKAPHHAMKR